MSYITFDKLQLINLEFSLKRELVRSNRAGSYHYRMQHQEISRFAGFAAAAC
jgi:hypothetical protein